MKKVLRPSVHLSKKMVATFIALCLLLVTNTIKAQIINETFEEPIWTSATNVTNATISCSVSGRLTLTATGTSSTVTYYTGYNQSTATTTSINTLGNSGQWLYSKASAGSSTYTKFSKNRSVINYMGLGTGGYIVTPILNNGVATVTIWVNVASSFAIGINTDTNAPSQPGFTSSTTSTIPTAYTYASQLFVSSSLTTGSIATNSVGGTSAVGNAMQSFSFSGSFAGACRIAIFNMGNSGIAIDDIVITEPVFGTPDIVLASSNPAVAASNAVQSSTKYPIYAFTLGVTTAPANLTQVDFTTAGTYVVSDVTKFQLWSNSTNDLSIATQVGTDITTLLGAGAHSFSSFSQNNSLGNTRYYWITTNIAAAATVNNTIAVSAIATSDLTFTSGNKTGAAFAGGIQTIVAPTAFRSKVSGNWSDATSWETFNGSIWVNAAGTPTSNDGTITIQNGHTITVTSNVSADELTINTGGEVDINSSITLTVANGSGTDATVNGILKNAGTLTLTGTASIESGGIYEHGQNNVTFPAVTYQTNGTLKITGSYAASTDLPIGTYQNIWFAGSVASTFYFRLGTAANSISGQLKVSATGAGDFLITSINNTTGQTVASFVQTGGNVMVNRDAGSGTRALTVNGDVDVSGGIFYIKQGTASSTGQLNVKGNITVSGGGIIKSDAGGSVANLLLNGSSQQTITGLTGAGTSGAINITTTNATSILLGSNMDIGAAATVTVSAGTLDLNGNTLTLKSDATGTARVATLVGVIDQTATGSKFSVQRYIQAKRAYRFFGHPFTTAIPINQLMTGTAVTFTGIDITGALGATNGFTASSTNNPSAFYYNNASGNSGVTPTDPGWAAFATAGTTDSNWLSKQGIRVLVRGTKSEGIVTTSYTPSATTVTMSGKINDGSSPTFTLLRTTPSTGEYNLIANPLASQIDLSATTRGSAVAANFSVWNPDISNGLNKGVYVTQPFATPYVLPIGGAFFATTTNGAVNNTIQFTEGSKIGTTPATLFRGNSSFGNNSVNLELTDGAGYADRLLLFFGKNKSSNNQEWWDAEKLANTDVNMYSISADNKKLSVDARPFPTKEDMVIPITLNTPTARNFTITAKDFELNDTYELLLHDKYNDIWTTLDKGVSYNFTVTSNAATQGERFEIVMKQMPTLIPIATSFTIKLSPNPATSLVKVNFTNEEQANTTITIINADGKTVKTIDAGNVQSGEVSINIRSLAKGSYFVILNNSKERKTEKLQVQ